MRVRVKVEGLRELDKALSQFTPTKRRTIGRKALDEAGEITAKVARALAPRDQGHLQESIDVSGSLNRSAKKAHRKQAEQERYIGPSGLPQAITQEFGTFKEPPQPFLRPAWAETQEAVLKRISDELWVGIEKAAVAAAKRAAKGK